MFGLGCRHGLWGPTKQPAKPFVTCSKLCLVGALLASGCGGGDNASESPATEARRHASEPTTSERTPTTDAGPRSGPSRSETVPKAPVLIVPEEPKGPIASKRSLERQRQMRQAKRLPQTRQAGCEKAVFPLAGGQVVWGPPTPRILSARQRGPRIEITFAFERLPRSPACRPYALTATVVSGTLDSPSFRLSDRRFLVAGRRARVVLRAPTGGQPPYTARAQAFTIDLRPSQRVEAPVR